MKNLFLLALSFFLIVACAHSGDRAPSSIPKESKIKKGAKLILKQPIPFINPNNSKQTVSVKSRKNLALPEGTFNCQLNMQVGKNDTLFFQEETNFIFKEKAKGHGYTFHHKQSNLVNLNCYNVVTKEPKPSLSLEEAQTAFPSDMLVIEPN